MFTSRSSSLPKNKTILAVADVLCVAGALFVSATLRFGWSSSLSYVQERASEVIAITFIFPVVFYIGGLYDTRRLRSAASSAIAAAVSVAVGAVLTGAYLYFTRSSPVGRGVALFFGTTVFASLVLLRGWYAHATARGMFAERCLVVGSRSQAERALALVSAQPDAGLRIVGVVVPRDGRPAQPGDPAVRREPTVLGTLDDLEDVVTRHQVDRLVVGGSLRDQPELLRRLRPLRYRGVGLMDLASLYEDLSREVPVDHIDEEWLLHAALNNSRMHIRRLKRVLDVAGSLALLVPAMLVLPFAALALKLTSKGPILFRQERVGLGAKRFMVLKLRTMYEDAEKLTGPVWSTENDPRITPVGRLLRKFRIDELPQLFNVLRGDMSLVGPRPERPVFVEKLCEETPFYSERLMVRPGITGWAQVMAPYASTVGDSIRKLQFDLYYVKHLSLGLDLLILVKTAKTMLFGRERAQGGMVAGRQLEATPLPVRLDRAGT